MFTLFPMDFRLGLFEIVATEISWLALANVPGRSLKLVQGLESAVRSHEIDLIFFRERATSS